jgi:hypothetical protein
MGSVFVPFSVLFAVLSDDHPKFLEALFVIDHLLYYTGPVCVGQINFIEFSGRVCA